MQGWGVLYMWNLLSKSMLLQPRIVPNYIHKTSMRLLMSSQRPPTVPIVIDEKDIKESFVRGSGPGGQKINKSKNNVHLVHIPTGIFVQCQETRDLTANRKIARKLLRDKLDLSMNGENSKLGRKFEKIRKQKRTAARRTSKKYGKDEHDNSPPTFEEDEKLIDQTEELPDVGNELRPT